MIIGNQKTIALLDRIITKGATAQAYLFSGPEHVGKFTIASKFAESLILENNFSDSISNAKKHNPPLDLILVEPQREEKRGIVKEKEISIEQIREAQNNLALFPYSGKYKVLVVDNASRMSIAAQNSLLKSLEEPNPTSVIILVSHNNSALLPTIKSRCQKISFSLVEDEQLKKMITEFSSDEVEEIALLSLGRPGLARRIIDDKNEFAERQEQLKTLQKLPSLTLNERLNVAENLAKNVKKAIEVLELWIWILHCKALTNISLRDFDEFSTIDKMEESINMLETTNANGRLVLENLLIDL